MAGLYIHIPFCREACNYCDFHFSISLENVSSMVEAINKEIVKEKKFLNGEELSTIYLGGGTPSILDPSEIGILLETIRETYALNKNAEITLEANPDDLNPEYLSSLYQLGINRLSIGIQSFFDDDLDFMNRRHDSIQSKECVKMTMDAGIDNVSLDLIYGLPEMSNEKWLNNIETALHFNPPHLATYHLTYESGTVLDYRRKKKKFKPVSESKSLDHYTILTEKMEREGYEHYEISNFALPGSISKHNSGYWKGEKYLGVGPSAHSFNGQIRRWNMSKNSSYIRGMAKDYKVYDEEHLDDISRLHDYLLTSLRTMWGVDLKYLKNEWGIKFYDHVLSRAEPFIKSGKILNVEGKIILTREGMFIADHLIADLFI